MTNKEHHLQNPNKRGIWGCIQKFPNWPPGARTANGTALYNLVQLYRHFVSQSSEFCRHNPLCCFSTSSTKGKRIFRYRLLPETFGYTLVRVEVAVVQLLPPIRESLNCKNGVRNICGFWRSLCSDYHTMKTYGGTDVELHPFLTSAPDGGEWSTSRADRLTDYKRAPRPLPEWQEAGWDPEPVWKRWCNERKKFLSLPRIETRSQTGDFRIQILIISVGSFNTKSSVYGVYKKCYRCILILVWSESHITNMAPFHAINTGFVWKLIKIPKWAKTKERSLVGLSCTENTSV